MHPLSAVVSARPPVAQDITDWVEREIGQFEAILPGVVLFLAAIVVIITYAKTRAFVPTLVAAVLGAFLWFAVQNIDWVGERVEQEITDGETTGG